MNTQTAPAIQAEACGDCRYWKNAADDKGQCRRHAPQSIVFNVDAETQFVSRFPETSAQDWCGDFQRRS